MTNRPRRDIRQAGDAESTMGGEPAAVDFGNTREQGGAPAPADDGAERTRLRPSGTRARSATRKRPTTTREGSEGAGTPGTAENKASPCASAWRAVAPDGEHHPRARNSYRAVRAEKPDPAAGRDTAGLGHRGRLAGAHPGMGRTGVHAPPTRRQPAPGRTAQMQGGKSPQRLGGAMNAEDDLQLPGDARRLWLATRHIVKEALAGLEQGAAELPNRRRNDPRRPLGPPGKLRHRHHRRREDATARTPEGQRPSVRARQWKRWEEDPSSTPS